MKVYRLWEGEAPGAVGTDPSDIPTLTDYGKKGQITPVMIVCPGGGYGVLADHEGAPIAHFFESIGVRALVLQYRLAPKYKHPSMLNDVHRAVRYVRAHHADLGVDPKRVGVLGFSAGGHLTSMSATLHDKGHPEAADPIEHESCRPDLAVLVYPVVTLVGPSAHRGSRNNLLGAQATDKEAAALSSDRNVSLDTCPCFMIHTATDTAVPPQNSLLLSLALADHHVPFGLQLMEKGPHGFGMGTPGSDLDWRPALTRWLKGRGFLG